MGEFIDCKFLNIGCSIDVLIKLLSKNGSHCATNNTFNSETNLRHS